MRENEILVIGSSNIDLIATMENFPLKGETLQGLSFHQTMGGKGANQAMAAHKAGGNVSFVTFLGNDVNGRSTLDYYKQEGLDVSLSLLIDNVPSGTAMIWVDNKGENSIVIIPGANNKLSSDYILKLEEYIARASVVVLQMEIPFQTIETICSLAHKHNTMVMLNVAPAYKLNNSLLKTIDILVVNKSEAETLTGVKVELGNEEDVVDLLLNNGVKTVLLTLGEKGSILKSQEEIYFVPAHSVKTIDTTAAGDTFCGAFIAEYMRTQDFVKALEFATAASAICVTRMGAQPSIPTQAEVYEFQKKGKLLISKI